MRHFDFSLVTEWYGRATPYSFRQLIPFAQRSNELTREIIPTPIRIDSQAKAPYMADGKCFIPSLFFTYEFYDKYLEIDWKDQTKAAIVLINGSQIHEALHHLLLGAKADYKAVITDSLKGLDKKQYSEFTHDDFNSFQTEVMKNCFNIVEDMFTENYCAVNYSHIYPFNQLMSEILFNDDFYEKMCEKVCSAESTFQDVLGFLSFYKNPNFLELDNAANQMYKQHIDILKKAQDVSLTLSQRFLLAYELFKLLKQEHGDEKGFDSQSKNSETDDSKNTIDKNTLTQSEVEQLLKGIPTKRLEDIASQFVMKYEDKQITQIKVELIDVMKDTDNKTSRYTPRIDRNPKFDGFAQYLINARAMKESFVQRREIGTKILPNRLQNALVDGKIFSKRDIEVMGKNNPEIIFLLDLSGSMRGWSDTGSLLDLTLNSAYTIFDSLVKNDIPCAFYGHTTNDENCLVVAIASHKMPLMTKNIETTYSFEQNFRETHKIDSNDNGDGFAVEFVGGRFSEKQGKKVLAVLSDGQPACYIANYGGERGIAHTANSAKILRDSNISVVSLSLVEGVMKTNNQIYGEENNIAAYGDNFETNMKNLISKIVI